MQAFNTLNKAWQELSIISGGVSSIYSFKKRIGSINKHWKTSSMPGDPNGVHVKREESLKDQTKRQLAESKNEPNEPLRIKLGGDGTRIGKRMRESVLQLRKETIF